MTELFEFTNSQLTRKVKEVLW